MQTTFLPARQIALRPDRQRQAFDSEALFELAQSIEQRGLIHALLVDKNGVLIAGERRLRAITEHLYPLSKPITYGGAPVPAGTIPCVQLVSDPDPLELEELELAENRVRQDLTWQETTAAHARLHALRERQLVARSDASERRAQTPSDTAREIFGPEANAFQRDTVRQELIIAKHLDKPEIAAAPTLRDAFKALKRIEDADRNKALSALFGETHSAADHQLVLGDCLKWMEEAVAEGRQFDVILTDPPYGMNAQNFGDAAGRMTQIDHQYDDSPEAWRALMSKWVPLSFKLAKPRAHAYVFCDIEHFFELRQMMQDAGWYVFRTPFTVVKRNSGRVPLPEMGPRRQSEWFLYAIKGKKPVNFIASDVIECAADENLSHGAQKPVALFHEILRRSVQPGDTVLDTFAGTGTILSAAHSLLCRATAIEQSPEYHGICLQRLQELTKQAKLL